MLISSIEGRVTDILMGQTYRENKNEISLGIFVMRTEYLRSLVDKAEAYNLSSLSALMLKNCKTENYRTYKFSGYFARVSSFLEYYRCSMELSHNESARESLLWKKDAPIFTKVNNSSPTKYTDSASVKSSMIADDSVIEGTVIGSVIFRGVHVEKGAIVKNSVLFRGTRVGKGAELDSIVCDVDVDVSEKVKLSGSENMPFYIPKGRRV